MSQDETAPVDEHVQNKDKPEEPVLPEDTAETPTPEQIDANGAEDTSEPVSAEESVQQPAGEELKETTVPDNKQAEEYLAGWQRTRAEFANYKKRVERELREGRERGAQDALAKLLPVIDDFERAMESLPPELADNPWVKGVALMLPKFHKMLTDYDVEPIDPVGEMFDPLRHEAIGIEDSDEVESGHVTVTLQKGYLAGERVLRPALVRVAS